jgi:hypothetical protein
VPGEVNPWRFFHAVTLARITGVKWFLRRSLPVRLSVLALALVVVALLARTFSGASDESPEETVEFAEPSPAALDPASTPATPVPAMGLAALGAPDDPLPPALPVPSVAEDAVDTLAQQVLAGTPESLPALITALQASGIGIVGPGTTSDVKPAEPWQGIALQRWEVRGAAAMVLPDRTVLFTLPDLAAILVEALPRLKGAPVEQLLVDDLRALADSPVPARRFFGRFIAALGRNASSHAPYDLLAEADPRAIELDGLQASLILRRLAIDVLMRDARPQPSAPVEKKIASAIDLLRGWLMPPVYAQGQTPCAMSSTAQSVAEIAAAGSSIAWGGVQVGETGFAGIMQRLGLEGLGNIASVASMLLGYAQFIATYAALSAEVAMDAPPLVRTKKMRPQTGERRQLIAVVKIDTGNAQMLNCLRAMLISVGLDFSLPNNGPVKGARVTWYGVDGFDQAAAALHGGADAIVQFVSSGAQRVTDAVTGDDGKVQIGVEGRGQQQNISNEATEVPKSAKVRLHVALKGADLFGDLSEAAGTAASGLVGLATVPLSVLARAQWASVGHYTFPVTDWRDGPPRWAGTITYTKVTAWNEPSSGKGGHSEQDYRESLTLNVTITETLDGMTVFGAAGAAMLQGTARASYTMRNSRSGGRYAQCGSRGPIHDLSYLQVSTGEGEGAGTARATVGIAADGQYSITVNPDVMMNTRSDASSTQMILTNRCQLENQSSQSPTGHGTMAISDRVQGDGRIDPNMPNRLTGRTEEKEGRTTRTITWDLQRQ